MFIQMLDNKCENNRIIFVKIEECYTSRTLFVDNKKPIDGNYDKTRRVHRGLFVGNNGVEINAHMNGAYQIFKKVILNLMRK